MTVNRLQIIWAHFSYKVSQIFLPDTKYEIIKQVLIKKAGQSLQLGSLNWIKLTKIDKRPLALNFTIETRSTQHAFAILDFYLMMPKEDKIHVMFRDLDFHSYRQT